jgi:hypothetical protein
MVLTTLAVLLLAAEPDPSFAVVATAPPELERAASSAGATLAGRLGTRYVELSGHLKTLGPGCPTDLGCLTSAPALSPATRLLHLRVSPSSGGRLAAELRLIDRSRLALVDRSAAILEPKELASWAEQAATRLFTRVSAPTRPLPPSPFQARTRAAAPASPAVSPGSTPRAPPPPAAPAPPVPKDKGVRGADEEP